MSGDLQLQLRSYRADLQRHSHDFHQLVLPVRGRLRLEIGNRTGAVDAERMAIIPAGTDHAFLSEQENLFVIADIPPALAPSLERLPAFLSLDPALYQYIRFLHRELARLAEGADAPVGRQMLLLLVQLMMARQGALPRVDRRVGVVRDYIESRFSEVISQQQLASVAHLSKRHLTTLFRQSFGMTPLQYLTELRMQRAWQLLEAGRLPVQQVAQEVGYSSLAAFSDRFRQRFGKPPSDLRRSGKI